MWELIRDNQRKSIMLFAGMALCLISLGYFIGDAFFPPETGGGMNGVFIACGIWIFMSFVSVFGGQSILLSVSGAKEISHEMHPQLFNVTEEMKIAANLPVMPKLYIIPEQAPNAFATGLSPENSAIAVTSGLLERLDRDELQGVIAHEMGHILNRDIRFMTLAGILLGSITLLSEVFLRGMFYSSGYSRRHSGSSRRDSGAQGQAVVLLIAVILAVLAPVMAQIFYFAISRKREYLADATAARLTRYPEGLASALEKIASSTANLSVANKITAPMYIVNPLKPEGMALSDLTSTHPPVQKRIAILRGMMHGVNFADYQKAYETCTGEKEKVFPASALADKTTIERRSASSPAVPEETAERNARNIGDLVRAAHGFMFLTCTCGLKMKLPPDFNKTKIDCPRCGCELNVPVADIAAAGAVLDTALGTASAGKISKAIQSPEILQYQRKTNGWETLQCRCGHHMQVSPLFAGTTVKCNKCERSIQIK